MATHISYNNQNDFTGTFWLVYGGHFYVSSLGDDSSGTGHPSSPFKTIQRAVTEAYQGEIIVIGSGEYMESIDGQSKDCNLIADGQVTLNGTFLPGSAFTNMGNNANVKGISVIGYNTVIKGKLFFNKCYIEDGVFENYGGVLRFCLLKDVKIFSTLGTYLYNCTLIKTETGADLGINNKFIEIVDCIFDSITTISLNSPDLTTFNYCNQETGSSVYIDGTQYQNPMAINTAFPQYQINGFNVDSKFNDPSMGDYSLKMDSILIEAGSWKQYIGAYGKSLHEDNVTLSLPTLTNIAIDDEGNYTLIQGYSQGTIETQEIDLGLSTYVGKITNFGKQYLEAPPDNAVFDKTSTYTNPNSLTFEMRWSDNIGEMLNMPYREFIWNTPPSIDFNGICNGEEGFNNMSAIGIKARFIQLRITLYDNTKLLLQESGCYILTEDGLRIKLEQA